MTAVRWRSSTAWIPAALVAAVALSWSAIAEVVPPAKEIVDRTLRSLRESSFTAHIVIKIPDGGEPRELVELVLYRRSGNDIRLEPVLPAQEAGRWYLLEKGGKNLRLVPDRREVLVLGKPRVGPVFTMLQMFLEQGCRRSQLAAALLPEQEAGQNLVRIYAPDGRAPFELVVDTRDYLPRVITVRPSRGRKWMMLALSQVKLVPPEGFAPEFFEVPPNWRVIGLPGPLEERERERLRNFRQRIPRLRPSAGGQPRKEPSASRLSAPSGAEEADEAKSRLGGFLPLVPTYLPEGFSPAKPRLLFFQGRLVFHLQLVNTQEHQLISIFEARGPEFFRDTEHLELPETICAERRLTEQGIFVLVLSSAVDAKELKAIADSLTDDPKRAEELVTQAIEQALGENEPREE